jgi:hypothetical protein
MNDYFVSYFAKNGECIDLRGNACLSLEKRIEGIADVRHLAAMIEKQFDVSGVIITNIQPLPI